MKNRVSIKRQKVIQQTLHKMREQEIRDIEKQLGLTLDPGVSRKIDIAMDTGDWATLELSESLDYKVLEMRYKTYKEIADAFRRLEAGTYGLCESCKSEIPLKRLKVEPFARYCVPCLNRIEEFEKAEKGIGKTSSL